MTIIKLNATDSTNDYLKELVLSQSLTDYTIVMAKLQLKGKGQRGAKWLSEEGKNLTVSILKNFKNFKAQNQFNLNKIVSLAVYDVLHELTVPDLYIKWPNDILSGNKKICGILIENILKGHLISKAILGIGLNVNQTSFKSIEKASSIKLILDSNKDFELDAILGAIQVKLIYYFNLSNQEIGEKYVSVLYRKDVLSIFNNPDGDNFKAYIRGVNQLGKLHLELEDGIVKYYGLKEITLYY